MLSKTVFVMFFVAQVLDGAAISKNHNGTLTKNGACCVAGNQGGQPSYQNTAAPPQQFQPQHQLPQGPPANPQYAQPFAPAPPAFHQPQQQQRPQGPPANPQYAQPFAPARPSQRPSAPCCGGGSQQQQQQQQQRPQGPPANPQYAQPFASQAQAPPRPAYQAPSPSHASPSPAYRPAPTHAAGASLAANTGNGNGGCDRKLEYTGVPGTRCQKFYRCDGVRLFTMDCAPGTLFDSAVKICSDTAVFPCC